MTTLAIKLNDASIAVARSDGLLVTEPGCAFESDEGIAFGEAGAALASGDRITVAGFGEEARLITVNDDGP